MTSSTDFLPSFGVDWTDTAHSSCHTWFPLPLPRRSSASTRCASTTCSISNATKDIQWVRCASCLVCVHQCHLAEQSDDALAACRPSFVDDERVHVTAELHAHHWSLVGSLTRRCLHCQRKVVSKRLGPSVGLVCLWCSSVYHQCCWQQISDAADDERNKCDYGQLR